MSSERERMMVLVAAALGAFVSSLIAPGDEGVPLGARPCASLVEVVGRVEREGVVCAASVERALAGAGGPRGCTLAPADRARRLGAGRRLRIGAGTSGRCSIRIGYVSGQLRLALGLGIDVNRAGPAELRALPGIGPRLAERIVVARRAGGPFRGVDDLTRVRGIGPKTVVRLREYLVVGSSDR